LVFSEESSQSRLEEVVLFFWNANAAIAKITVSLRKTEKPVERLIQEH
jgi:hypothetical protein